MEKIHQLQRLRYILESGGIAPAPATVTLIVDDSDDMYFSKHILRQFAAYMDYRSFKKCRLLNLVDIGRSSMKESIYDEMTDVLVVDATSYGPEKYIEKHFDSFEAYFANICLILDSALNQCAARLDFETEPMFVTIDHIPRHIVILSPTPDVSFLMESEIPELVHAVDVIDLRGAGCADVLDSAMVFRSVFKPNMMYSKEAIPVLLLNWKPPTYWGFIRSRK